MLTLELTLPPDIESPRRARHFVEEALPEESSSRLGDVVALLVSELVTNAVLHARSEIRLRIGCGTSQALRVEVADTSPVAPVVPPVTDLAATGRGMLLVDALADAWGMQPEPHGKTVWFELSPAAA